MKTMTVILSLAVGLAICSAIPSANADDVQSSNKYVDDLLNHMRTHSEIRPKLDPYSLPDYLTRYFKVSNSKVRGFSRLQRSADCSLKPVGQVKKLTAYVRVSPLRLDGEWIANPIFKLFQGTYLASLTELSVQVDSTIRGRRAQLDSLKITKMGKFKIEKITGLHSALEMVFKFVTNGIAKYVNFALTYVVEKSMSNQLRDILENYDWPV